MNSHRDEHACVVDPGSDGRPEIFDRLLDASSLGAPDVLQHEAMTPRSFFAELDTALDEEYANQAKNQPATQEREGDVDDALLRLVERAAQPIALAYAAHPTSGSSRPTWIYPSDSLAVSTCSRPLHETDVAGEEHIRLWYLPAADSRVFVSFVEYERPSKVRALLAALLTSSQEAASTGEADRNLNVFSNLREDVARSILAVGFDSQPHFEPIVQACSSAIVASHIGDDLESYLRSSAVNGSLVLAEAADSLVLFRRFHAELGPGVVRPVLESSESATLRTWTSLLRTVFRRSDEQGPANAPTVPLQRHQGIDQPDSQCDFVLVAAGSGKTSTIVLAECKTLCAGRDTFAHSEGRRLEESVARLWRICIRDIVDELSPWLLNVASLTSATMGVSPWLLKISDPGTSANGLQILENRELGRYSSRWPLRDAVRSFRLEYDCRVVFPWHPREEAMSRSLALDGTPPDPREVLFGGHLVAGGPGQDRRGRDGADRQPKTIVGGLIASLGSLGSDDRQLAVDEVIEASRRCQAPTHWSSRLFLVGDLFTASAFIGHDAEELRADPCTSMPADPTKG